MVPEDAVKRLVVTLSLLFAMQGSLTSTVFAQPVKRPVETALPPTGPLPTWNPLPPAPGVHDEPEQHSIQARVLHFLFHLFGGSHTPVASPFSNECGQRPCMYDQRN